MGGGRTEKKGEKLEGRRTRKKRGGLSEGGGTKQGEKNRKRRKTEQRGKEGKSGN